MSQPRVSVRLDGNGRTYQPSEAISGEYEIESVEPDQLKAVEISVLWVSEGKGDEDMEVHDFHRIECLDGQETAPELTGRFDTVLPLSPLSYEGLIVKIRWYVRVRAFLARGKQIVGQRGFRLGSVPAPKPPSP